jgi:hypothetical protein
MIHNNQKEKRKKTPTKKITKRALHLFEKLLFTTYYKSLSR